MAIVDFDQIITGQSGASLTLSEVFDSMPDYVKLGVRRPLNALDAPPTGQIEVSEAVAGAILLRMTYHATDFVDAVVAGPMAFAATRFDQIKAANTAIQAAIVASQNEARALAVARGEVLDVVNLSPGST